MKLSSLAHVLNMSANALLIVLDITDDNECDSDPPELDECLQEPNPSAAKNNVTQTMVKVCSSTSIVPF